MNRRALKVLVVAVLAAGAIVAAAGTVDDVRTDGGGTPGADDVDRSGTSTTATEPAPPTRTTVAGTTGAGAKQDCLEFMTHPLVVLAIVTLWAGIVYWIYRRNGPMEATAAFLCILIFMFLAYPALAICNPGGQPQTPNESGEVPELPNRTDGAGGDGVGDGSGDDGPSTPDLPFVLLAILAILAVAAVGGVLVTRGDDDEDLDVFDDAAELPEEEDVGDVDAVAAAAGRAADRIEETTDLDNEIYRAWVEMTEHLDVEHPESSTPGEFARAALAAGIDRDDVTELTELFERVRYGAEEPTPDRESRALDALRRIERQYGDDAAHQQGGDGE
jgi:hypothetical protein